MPTQPPAAGTVPASLASWKGPVERGAPAESNDDFDFVSCNDQRDRRGPAIAHTGSSSAGDSPRRPEVPRIPYMASRHQRQPNPRLRGLSPHLWPRGKDPLNGGPGRKVTIISILSVATINAIAGRQQQHTRGRVPTGTVPGRPGVTGIQNTASHR
jgi:hypothetical protein